MKKIIIALSASLILLMASIPYLIGKVQFDNVTRMMQNYGDSDTEHFEGTDGDIEDCLRVFGFNIGWEDTPTFTQYYQVGWAVLMESL